MNHDPMQRFASFAVWLESMSLSRPVFAGARPLTAVWLMPRSSLKMILTVAGLRGPAGSRQSVAPGRVLGHVRRRHSHDRHRGARSTPPGRDLDLGHWSARDGTQPPSRRVRR